MQKKVFTTLLIFFVFNLIFLPFVVTFNDFLTKVVEGVHAYSILQQHIVPVEVKMVVVLLSPFHVRLAATPAGVVVNGLYAGITWNCIGWQSLLLFCLSLIVGLRMSYTKQSMGEAIAIGLLGTFLINLLRMAFTVLLLAFSQPLFAVIFHDYLAAGVTIAWMFAFWWFAYGFVLETKIDTSVVNTLP